jgi:hypothetical protein
MKRNSSWRLLQAVGASVLIAVALVMAEQPYPDICLPCVRGEVNWWLCLLAGCLW